MTHFFEKRDVWGNRYGLWIVVLMAFFAPLCWWSMREIRFESDVEKWLPDNDSEHRIARWTHDQFPDEERVLLTWDGSSINDPRVSKVVEQLVGAPDARGIKRGGLPYVGTVVEPRQLLEVMQRNGIEPHEAVRRLEGTILGAGPLRLRLSETGRSALRKTKRDLQSAMRVRFGLDLAILDASPDLTPQISIPGLTNADGTVGEPSSPTILMADGKMAETSSVEHDLQVAWKGMRIGSESTIAVAKWLTEFTPERGEGKTLVETGFFAPGSPVALAIGISEAGMADKAETLSAIRSVCKLAGIPDDSVHMSGVGVSATELNDEILKSAWDFSIPLTQFHRRSVILTSLLVIGLLVYLLVRDVRIATMILCCSIFAISCSMAIVSVTGSAMNMAMVIVPTVLMALTASGAIYVTTYWRRAAVTDESTAISESVRKSWLPCFLASLTAAIGFASLCTSRLIPVRDFGFHAALGTMISFFTVVYGFPALLQMSSIRALKPQELERGGWRFFGRIVTTHSGWQSLAVIAICIACSFGLTKFRTETKMVRYFPERARVARDYWWIETSLAGVMPVETIVRFDVQSLKDTNFLDRMEIVRQVQEQIRIHPEISGSTSLADFEPVSERLSEDSSFMQRTKFNKRASTVQQQIRDGEIPAAKSYYCVAERQQDLVEPGDGKLNQAGDELWRITAHVNLMSENDFESVLADLHRITQDVLKMQPGSNHVIAGTVPLFVKTQHAFSQTITSSLCMAALLIFGVFIFLLRSFAAGIVAMVPNVVPITVVFGILSWAGERIDIGSMITASVALGIAAHGSLHYLTCARSLMANGRTRRDAIVESMAICGPAMWQSSTVVAIGMLMLVPAELLLISRFGGLMAAMIGMAFFGNVVFMPQLLGSPLGRLFEPKKSKDLPQSTNVQIAPPLAEQVAASTTEESAIPSPHIKQHMPAVKKRRTSSRRDPDPEAG